MPAKKPITKKYSSLNLPVNLITLVKQISLVLGAKTNTRITYETIITEALQDYIKKNHLHL